MGTNAVSYTHLDVYKRQASESPTASKVIKGQLASSTLLTGMVKAQSEPVSYTHLDVYKRQLQMEKCH